MEYRGFRYEIRRAVGRDQWVWTVYIPEPKSGKVVGDRTYATLRAKRVIDIYADPMVRQSGASGGRSITL